MNYLKQFQYNEQIIGQFIDVLTDHPQSSDHVKSLLSHILNAMEIWVARIEERDAVVDVWQVHEPSRLHEMNRKCHEDVFRLLEHGNLRKAHLYTNTEGKRFQNTLDEVLTHLMIHSAHHRAQISYCWSESGIKPPSSDFIFWSRQKIQP